MLPLSKGHRAFPQASANEPLFSTLQTRNFCLSHLDQYPTAAPDDQSTHLDGGLLSRGYSTVVIEPEVERSHLGDDARHPYLALTPV